MAKNKDDQVASGELLVCRNAKARHRYEIDRTFEAGLVLTGSEVKSLRARRADLEGAYAGIERGEAYLTGMHIAPYEFAGHFGHEPKRKRKLLLNGNEIQWIMGRLTQRGYTLVPLRVYFKRGRAKVEIGLGKGKAHHDRREEIKRDVDMREARDAMRRR